MGNSVIWFLPDGADRMARIDFGRQIGNIEGPNARYRQVTQEAMSGFQSSVLFAGLSTITLGHTWNRGTRDATGDGDLLRRKLVTLVGHLQRGGTCIFVGDEDHCQSGFAIDPPPSETGSITIDVDLFSTLASSLSSGREVMVQTDHDKYLFEHKLCSDNTGLTFTLAQNIAMDMSAARWVLVREYFTYPALRMPAEFRDSGNFVNHDHEMTFTLALPLEEDPGALDQLWADGVPFPGEDPGPPVVIEIPDFKGSTGDDVYRWR